jgi:GT2 family glycosyltransferase
VQACAQPGVAAASGKLVDSSGEPQVGFQVRRLPGPAALACEILGVNRLWPGNPVNRRYRCLDLDAGCSAWVEQPAGAFLMLQRDAWRALGGFDESFRPLWFEDVDFAKRALDAGYRIAYVPEAAARHCGGGSARRLSTEKREMFWYGNLLKYASKHFCGWGLRAVCAALILGSCLRAAVGVCRSGSLKPVVIYGRVIRLTGKYWLSGPGGTTLLLAVTARK